MALGLILNGCQYISGFSQRQRVGTRNLYYSPCLDGVNESATRNCVGVMESENHRII